MAMPGTRLIDRPADSHVVALADVLCKTCAIKHLFNGMYDH